MQIREITLQELDIAYALVQELRSALSYEEFENLIYDMRHEEYKMFGIFEKDALIVYSGLKVQVNLYHQRHIFVDDLITKQTHRFQGYGKEMLLYIDDYAKINMCNKVVLNSGFQRSDAHHFYENYGYEKKSFVFVKELN